ncbi:prolyl oligopeptidase family serine peptidase [Rugamonas sp. FT103W]|uniref:Prolyl oligopeptidase family serine peptidase n=2 Tax=Rugamonas rivuli TaxID=2743358 RepID=A0A843SEJ7_9BURK|nr:prolyl oligopeptidase family serine peptidase [Rugamonas rivuli]
MTMQTRYRQGLATLPLAAACAAAHAGPLPVVDARMGEQVVAIPAKIGGADITLQTTIYKPPGDGPFPVLFMNHGKNGGDAHQQPRARYPVISREFVKRGYAVVIPMRQGFAGSGGTYVNSHCQAKLNGEDQASSLYFAMAYAMKQPWADQQHVIIAGQSHGGLTAIAAGSHNISGVQGVINFAGGVNSRSHCNWQAALVDAFKAYGAVSTTPSIWFYGANDQHFGPKLAAEMYAAYTGAGGKAQLVAYGPFKRDAHSMSSSPDGVAIWLPETTRFLQGVGMPTEIKYTIKESR